MRMNAEEKVFAILERRCGLGRDQISKESRLVQDLKLDGDDAIDTLLEVSKACSMDISSFDSSEYFRSELSLLSVFRKLIATRAPHQEAKKAITVGQLIEAARRGRLFPQ